MVDADDCECDDDSIMPANALEAGGAAAGLRTRGHSWAAISDVLGIHSVAWTRSYAALYEAIRLRLAHGAAPRGRAHRMSRRRGGGRA